MTREEALEWCLPLYQNHLKSCFEGSSPPRGAIKALCGQCMGYDRKEITECSSEGCPLWVYRPYQEEA